MAFVTQKPPWRLIALRLITIVVIGLSLHIWIDACTNQEREILSIQDQDNLLDQQELQSTTVICQIDGRKKDVFLVSTVRNRCEYGSGRISIRETIDTTFMGSVSIDVDCYQSLKPWVKAMIKKDALAHQ